MPDIQSVRQAAAQGVATLKQLMAGLQLDDTIGVWHEFVPHASTNAQTIQAAAQAVDRMPKSDKEYFEYALTVGSALSSIGALEEAERFISEARKKAPNADQRAFAGYNLFIVRLRLEKYEDALDVLMTAIRHDPKRYSLHDANKYRPIKILGAGGLGVVFQCENPDGGRPVVVKALWEPTAAGDGVFADIQRLMQSPHEAILLPKDFGWSDADKRAHPYFVYDRIPGIIDGEEWLAKNGKMAPEQGMAVGARILDALAAAHNVGVAHYDLKPSNIYFKQAGGELQVFVADFGLGRVGVPMRQRALQNPDPAGKGFLGRRAIACIDYAAPEVRAAGQAGFHSDMYSFGSLMYRFLTGDPPRETSGTALPSIAGLYQLILTCREEDATKRPPTITGLAQWWADPSKGPEAAGIATGIGTAQVADPLTGALSDAPLTEEVPKSKMGLIIGIVAAVVVLGGVGAFFAFGGKKKEGNGAAKKEVPKAKPLVSEKEAVHIAKWYKAARTKVFEFLAAPCRPLHQAGYKYESHLIAEKKTREVRGRMRDYTQFILQLKPAGSPSGKLDIFECPARAAQIQRDQPYKLWLKIRFYRANMFSRGHKLAVLKVSGKLTHYLSKTTYNSVVAYKARFSLPALRGASDSGIAALGRGKPYKLTKKGLQIANLFFKRIGGKGKVFEGRYEVTLTSDKFVREMTDWSSGCSGLTASLKKLPEPRGKDKKHRQLFRAAVDWSTGFCDAIKKMKDSIAPYNEAGVTAAANALVKAKENWNANIYKAAKKFTGSASVELKEGPF